MILALLLAAEAAAPFAALGATLKTVKSDGAVRLSDEAQTGVLALLPPQPKGMECPDKAQVAGDALGLKDRGDGPLLVVEVATCHGGRVLAVSTGEPPRVARLLESEGSPELKSLKALSLSGRERDLGLEILAAPTVSELHLYTRGDGFTFQPAGTLRDFTGVRECATGGDEGAGWSSFLRPERDRLALLRVDLSCGGAPWQASCALYRVAASALEHAGVCPLPKNLDQKALKVAGWK